MRRALFRLLLFFLPFQLGWHWTRPNSYLNGVLVDYLIPTLYLTDLLSVAYLLQTAYSQPQRLQATVTKLLKLPLIWLTVAPILAADRPFIALIWLLRLGVYSLSFCLAKPYHKDNKTDIQLLTISGVGQGLLAIYQFVAQRPLAPYWLLGESRFDPSWPNVKKTVWLGQLKVVPMGTTPHPNVLAGFLLLTYWLTRQKYPSNRAKPIWLIIQLIGLGLTQSWPVLSILLLTEAWLQLSPQANRICGNLPRLAISWAITAFTSVIFPIIPLLSDWIKAVSPSISRRVILTRIAVKMIVDHWWLGVGWQNFTVHLDNYDYLPLNFRFYQPVHNIILLTISQAGWLGTLPLILLAGKAFRQLLRKPYAKKCFYHLMFLLVLGLGLVDHYWLSLPTGMLMFMMVTVYAFYSPLTLTAPDKTD